jgi:transcriptional regulator with XRE-family HTH domain
MHMDRCNVVLTRVEEGITMKSDIDNKEVGKRLQNFREVRGLTRAVLALRLDMSEKDLEDIEAGKKQLSPENIEVLRETFAVDPAWLLGGQTP